MKQEFKQKAAFRQIIPYRPFVADCAAIGLAACLWLPATLTRAQVSTNSFFNFETAPVHPVALSPDGTRLAVCNLPDNHLEIFDVTSGLPVSIASIPVSLDPVAVAFRTDTEIWVANYISSSISLVDLPTLRVFNTIITSNEPSDIVFAGTPELAYVSCGQPNLVEVFDPEADTVVTNLSIDGNRPRAMAASPDGTKVYVGIFESGNASTIIGTGIGPLFDPPRANPVSLSNAPSLGVNPPPNSGTNFVPAINPALPAPPPVGLIVKKNSAGRWMDDNNGDWTEFISGTNAALTGRVPGWDLPDHDLAVINTADFSISYATGLMNICMAVAVNPSSGTISVVGTDAINNIRFTPVLNGIFIRVNIAEVDPTNLTATVADLNPHLDYQESQVSEASRDLSLGDPRGMAWSADGTRGYVTGMGSDNLIIVDALGNRITTNAPINLGQGPTGLAVDDARNRLYVYNRFDGSITTVDTGALAVVNTQPLFDPTPAVIKAGRPLLYNTHETSGLGQAACASCHVDARLDRLAWDLGDPTAQLTLIDSNFNMDTLVIPVTTHSLHPMKGPMVTITLQDIIGHEPFHWRGDRDGIEAFDVTYTELQGAEAEPDDAQMEELKEFLATIGFAPNPFRTMSNTLSTSLPLPGQLALGRGALPAGAQLPNGNAQAGQNTFRTTGANALNCSICHTLPTGLGPDARFSGGQWVPLPVDTNGSHHCALVEAPRSANLAFKMPQLRNLSDKFGMDLMHTNSRAGFGFSHDGSVDSLVRFVQDGFGVTNDQTTADLVAFLISITGSDLTAGSIGDGNNPPGVGSQDTQAGVGRQITITNGNDVPLIDTMLALAGTGTNRVDLVVKGMLDGVARGWFYDAASGTFLSDRTGETYTPAALRALAAPGSEQTYMLVPKGSGRRIGIDRDLDGFLDGDLVVNSLTAATNGVTVNCSSVVGLNYELQFKTNLTDASWSTLPGTISGTGNTINFTDGSAGTNCARYYRVTTQE